MTKKLPAFARKLPREMLFSFLLAASCREEILVVLWAAGTQTHTPWSSLFLWRSQQLLAALSRSPTLHFTLSTVKFSLLQSSKSLSCFYRIYLFSFLFASDFQVWSSQIIWAHSPVFV